MNVKLKSNKINLKKWLIKSGFSLVKRENSPFKNYFMSYFVKDRFILFFNEDDNSGDSFLMALGEGCFGKYDVASIRWTNDKSEIRTVYEVLTKKAITVMSRTRDKRESPAKRFRNVLYHMWQIDDAGFEDFDVFYDDRMEKLIEYYIRQNKKHDKNSNKK